MTTEESATDMVAYEAGKDASAQFFTDLKWMDAWNALGREVMSHPLANVTEEDLEQLKRRISVDEFYVLEQRCGAGLDLKQVSLATLQFLTHRSRTTVLRMLEQATKRLRHVLQERYALELCKYAEIKHGEYFLSGRGDRDNTVFYQDGDDRIYTAMSVIPYKGGESVPVTRPRPIRLWDGQFHALPLDMPTRTIGRKEALICAKKTREMLENL